MSFPVTCPECREWQTVPDEFAGKRIRCENCKAIFRAGTAETDRSDNKASPRSRQHDRDESDPRHVSPAGLIALVMGTGALAAGAGELANARAPDKVGPSSNRLSTQHLR